ncbi:class I SAM-dependent methyltransferase [Pseudidiomarina donghaiensis]|uniref:Class I SAM-dependent methyltransferase n=1 Tax=Pseudidiomarina donghaiensis TaxID=519452 RepID=A0A432XIA0_9GAMM|nr:class I SAM-dependent methyltransferase [Pseudidiomarina donghaiensis]RUO48458.1 class I SAM-dependent methyltransferase [Pseudidiomarina donghaiensis]SFV24114.1 Methyltransferase domain-containing protein [Pseudidiomarina donghaiensis]
MKNIAFYHTNADKLASQYDSLTFEQVHADWLPVLQLLPRGASIVDIGAGSGRDALALHHQGFHVTGVEPADKLRKLGQQKSSEIIWLDDKLPELRRLKLNQRYDLVLISAVWMHLGRNEQKKALKSLKQLLKPNGFAVITLRFGHFDDGRTAYELDADWLIHEAATNSLQLHLNSAANDKLARHDVSWQTLVFRRLPE